MQLRLKLSSLALVTVVAVLVANGYHSTRRVLDYQKGRRLSDAHGHVEVAHHGDDAHGHGDDAHGRGCKCWSERAIDNLNFMPNSGCIYIYIW